MPSDHIRTKGLYAAKSQNDYVSTCEMNGIMLIL